MVGLTVCRMHGGSTQAARTKSEMVKIERKAIGMRKYTEPISPDDWEANPINSFEMEFRRTIAHIRYYEEKIAQLREEDFIWGQTKEEDVNATEFAGTNVTYESGMHVYEQALFRERRHLHDLHKTFIGANLITKKIEAERELMDRLELAISGVIVALGRDPRDPEIRAVIRNELAKAAA
jgi:hypothetical protein